MRKAGLTSEGWELLRNEVETLRLCQQEHILHLHEVLETDGEVVLVTETLAGGDLFSYLERRSFKLSEKRAATLIAALGSALEYLHGLGVVHRDIKPENVMLVGPEDDSEVKIIDFGLATILGPQDTCSQFAGTIAYAAPEMLRNFPYGPAIDVWSLGILAYLLLSGRMPHPSQLPPNELKRYAVLQSRADGYWSMPLRLTHLVGLTVHPPRKILFSVPCLSDLIGLLAKNPAKRITAKDINQHPWIRSTLYAEQQ